MTQQRPVRPRNAASLILFRRRGDALEFLMGKRPTKSAFIPDAFVFPGGGMSPEDAVMEVARPLRETTIRKLTSHGREQVQLAPVLANTAIRETYEETGLSVGPEGRQGELPFTPDHSAIDFVGRAITPSESPIRFHARFFITDGGKASGTPRSNGELIELDWYPAEEAKKLPIIDVTEFMLHEALARLAEPDSDPERTPLYSYRGTKPIPRYL